MACEDAWFVIISCDIFIILCGGKLNKNYLVLSLSLSLSLYKKISLKYCYFILNETNLKWFKKKKKSYPYAFGVNQSENPNINSW